MGGLYEAALSAVLVFWAQRMAIELLAQVGQRATGQRCKSGQYMGWQNKVSKK